MELATGAMKLHVPVVIDPRLNEVNFGRFQGRRPSSLAEQAQRDIDYLPENGESYRIVAARVFSFLVDLAAHLAVSERSRTMSVVFCHAGILRIVSTLCRPIGDPAELFGWRFVNASSIDLALSDVQLPAFWLGKSQRPAL